MGWQSPACRRVESSPQMRHVRLGFGHDDDQGGFGHCRSRLPCASAAGTSAAKRGGDSLLQPVAGRVRYAEKARHAIRIHNVASFPFTRADRWR